LKHLQLLAFAGALMAGSPTWAASYSDPACWKEPRMWHDGPITAEFANKVSISRVPGPLAGDSTRSPNNSYAYVLHKLKDRADLMVFTDAPDLLKVSFAAPYTVEQPAWVNEKLLFVRVWWGRVLLSDLVIDVERGEPIYREMVYDGDILFQQAQETCKGRCPCP
jgi:hypothetical protein